jgi:hypothetical protein
LRQVALKPEGTWWVMVLRGSRLAWCGEVKSRYHVMFEREEEGERERERERETPLLGPVEPFEHHSEDSASH